MRPRLFLTGPSGVGKSYMIRNELGENIRKAGGKILESVDLFDVYQGSQIEAGKKSVAYSLKFRAADRTLSDEDIDPALEKIFAKLKENDCILRS